MIRRIQQSSLSTRILLGLFAIILIAGGIMLMSQQKGASIDQYRTQGEVRFESTRGEEPIILEVDIADTPYKHSYGLMFRGQMDWGRGMLFVFTGEDTRSFWMKNTYIPLDLIFLDKEGIIVHMHTGAKTLDTTPIPSIYPAQYVIEVNSGWVNESLLTTGMIVDLSRIASIQ